MGRCCDVLTYLTLSLGYILVVVCIFSPFWKVNDQELTFRDDIIRHQGLWVTCDSFTTGNWGCRDFDRWILGLPTEIQVGRAVGIAAFVLGMVALLALLFGLCSCENCEGGENCGCGPKTTRFRRNSLLTAGICSLLAGLGIIAVTGYYANKIMIQYYQLLGSDISRWVFGWALFVGWVGGALMVLVAVAILIMACRITDDDEYSGNYQYDPRQPDPSHRNYAYQPEQPATIYNKEYV